MYYPVGLVKNSIKGNIGTLAIFDLGDCIAICKFKYNRQVKEVELLDLKVRIFVNKEFVLDSIAEWILNQKSIISVIYAKDI